MKELFTKKTKRILLKGYEYMPAIFLVFLILSYFYSPTCMSDIERRKIRIMMIEEDNDYNAVGGGAPFFNMFVEGENIPYVSYNMKVFYNYGIDRLINKELDITFIDRGDYKQISDVSIEGKPLISLGQIGFFPFTVFVILCIISFMWFIYGVYIDCIISDTSR